VLRIRTARRTRGRRTSGRRMSDRRTHGRRTRDRRTSGRRTSDRTSRRRMSARRGRCRVIVYRTVCEDSQQDKGNGHKDSKAHFEATSTISVTTNTALRVPGPTRSGFEEQVARSKMNDNNQENDRAVWQ
jgi:hypothetical protein